MTRTFLIDTDTASDDAVALIMALRAPDVRVAAITVVAGNVDVQQATRNALYTAELCGVECSGILGCGEATASHLSRTQPGFTGATDWAITTIPRREQSAERLHAVDAIIETIEANPGIVLVTLGPLTNVALAVSKGPEIAAKVSRCVVMGGAPCCEGNVTPAAEYNIWVDPEAASIVMRSGLPVELIGWQLCRGDAVLGELRSSTWRHSTLNSLTSPSSATVTRALLYKIQTNEDGICLPDPVAMCLALDPTVGTEWSEHYVEVETQSELTRGMTVVDRLNVAGDERNRKTGLPRSRDRRPRFAGQSTTSAGRMRSSQPCAKIAAVRFGLRSAIHLRISGASQEFSLPGAPQELVSVDHHSAPRKNDVRHPRDLDPLKHRVIDAHVVSLRADRVLAFRIENDQVSIAADGDRPFAWIQSKEFRRGGRDQFHKTIRAEPPTGHAAGVNQDSCDAQLPALHSGIFVKSSRPISFCSLKQNGQWSVETTCR